MCERERETDRVCACVCVLLLPVCCRGITSHLKSEIRRTIEAEACCCGVRVCVRVERVFARLHFLSVGVIPGALTLCDIQTEKVHRNFFFASENCSRLCRTADLLHILILRQWCRKFEKKMFGV